MYDKPLTELVKQILLARRATVVGIATPETLAGGPPSTDLDYVLPGAKAAVSFAVPFDQEKIEAYLSKRDHRGHQQDNFDTNVYATGLAVQLASYLDQIGYASYGLCANGVYRKDTPNGTRDFMPDISHRYVAVASGVGWFGFSGNVITKEHGPAVVLGTTLTTAPLEPTEPLPDEDRYCDRCQLCLASCCSGLMDKNEDVTVTLGGREFSYSARRSYRRCDLVCGGFTGMNKSGKWSTWSPGRFPIPDSDEEFDGALVEAVRGWMQRPVIEGGFHHPALYPMGGRPINMTCGNCQLVCHPDRDERKRRYRLLTDNGVVIQREDGSLEAVAPDIGEKHLSELPDDRRKAYERI